MIQQDSTIFTKLDFFQSFALYFFVLVGPICSEAPKTVKNAPGQFHLILMHVQRPATEHIEIICSFYGARLTVCGSFSKRGPIQGPGPWKNDSTPLILAQVDRGPLPEYVEKKIKNRWYIGNVTVVFVKNGKFSKNQSLPWKLAPTRSMIFCNFSDPTHFLGTSVRNMQAPTKVDFDRFNIPSPLKI